MNSLCVQERGRRIHVLWIAALVCLSSVSCLRKLDPSKVVCKEDGHCPKDYFCFLADGKDVGLCRPDKPLDAGSSDSRASDGPSGGGSGSRDGGLDDPRGVAGAGSSARIDAGGGGSTTDSGSGAGGGGISWPDALPPSDAPGAPAGTSCTANGECSSGHCIDDVCCAATECAGCFACAQALTNQPDGTCAPVASGKTAHGACTDETASNPCGNDGTCDGKGACRKAAAGTSCGAGSCNAKNEYVPAPTCDGKGVCASGTSQPCSPHACLETGCDKKCGKQEDCEKGTYCDLATGNCKATKTNGTTAQAGYECSSGIVADNVCCNEACTGCSACHPDLNGQRSDTIGTCRPVLKGKTAPHDACPKSTDPCGMDGTCNGAGECTYPALGAECGSKSCALATSTLTKSTCDSLHTCKQTTASCPGAMACLATGADCRPGPCANDTDCAANHYCTTTGTCAAKSGPGSLCTPATASQCDGGACVDGRCCAQVSCDTCQSCTGTGGTCVSVTNAEDPDTCSGTRACDVTGACRRKIGQSCSQGSDCLSGYCSDGVCCDRACTGSCEYCNNAGLPGQCAYITGSPRTGHPACPGEGACQGTCKGGKADCDMPGRETTCRQQSCLDTTTQIEYGFCLAGTGICEGQSTKSCGLYACSAGACLTSCTRVSDCSGTNVACISNACRACSAGLTSCETYCANLAQDVNDCGACGTRCTSPNIYCQNSKCVACTGDSQCTAAGYVGCVGGNCVCRQKNAGNWVPNPGFDGSGSSWQLNNGAAYASGASNDADGCPGSGSLHLGGFSDSISVCFPVSGTSSYGAGVRYKGALQCSLGIYGNSQCTGSSLKTGSMYKDSPAPTWASFAPSLYDTMPAGAVAAKLSCSGAAGESWVDQFYFNTSGGGF